MKKIKLKILLGLSILLLPNFSLAAITFTDGKWETTFDYAECSQRGLATIPATDCATVATDEIYWSWSHGNTFATNYGNDYRTSVRTVANNPFGLGGNGFRTYKADGINQQSGEVRVDFPAAQRELWIRWYMRYEAGFTWLNNQVYYNKVLYINSGSPGVSVIPEFVSHSGDSFASTIQGGAEAYQVNADGFGWSTIMGGNSSDGIFHCFEVYIKMDTNGTDGAGSIWIDGVLVKDAIGVDFSGGNIITRDGWTWFEMASNQNAPNNGRVEYVDYDDIIIYNQTPPNLDANGNSFIGPIDWVNGEDNIPPSSPSGLSVL